MAFLVFDKNNTFALANLVLKLTSVVLCIGMLFISRYAFIFFILAIIPTIVAMFFDRNKSNYIFSIIYVFNLMSTMPFLRNILQSSTPNLIAKNIIENSTVWITIYGAIIIGQLIYLIFPWLVCYMYTIKCDLLVNNLKKKKEKISLEWGVSLEDGDDLSRYESIL